MSPFILASSSILIVLAVTILVPLFGRNQRLLINVSFPLSAIASCLAVSAGVWTVWKGGSESYILHMGLPDLPFHLRLDSLSGFFLTIVGLLGLFVSIYSIGYVKGFLAHRSVLRLVIFYNLFMAGMLMVILADDALFFLISWEVMAAASYFLVMFEDEKAENRRAAFIYLVVAHVGAIAILLSFGVMAGLATGFEGFNGYTFDAMRHASFTPAWAAAAFFLAFFGFAAKAGMIPLHVWLPEAHPVAPSNVSALMSGVMLKTAIYGIVRVAFDLIKVFPWWWGAIVLVFGLITALFGILYAIMQHDLKKLLAYSSVENIGIILIGIGLSMVYASFHMPVFAALALIAGLYHALNHAMFKGLLFMGAGAVLHSTHERSMEQMGGLIHKMPWTSVLFLFGCISIAALPPFNGFVSEWLTFQAFLLSPSLPSQLLKLIFPLAAALLALTAALAARCFVKAYGMTFLGQWRGLKTSVHEVTWTMKAGMILSAITCLVLGVFPTIVISWMDIVPEQLVGGTLTTTAGQFGWLWLTPISHARASYSAPLVLIIIPVIVFLIYIFLHTRKTAIHRGPIWDCGFAKLNTRMQYTGTSFSMPIRRIFGFIFMIKEDVRIDGGLHKAFPKSILYRLRVRDRLWGWFYTPVADSSFWIARKTGKLQQGRIQMYLVYSFVTIIILLVLL
ncbi:MAG: hydrogenase 4 subunit B [Nitrospirae bacterium]|nr:hydrogenase 4 subunit B [Nitrospirota bacterium]